MKLHTEWKECRADLFWSEIAPCDHVVQIYEDEAILVDTLSGFIGGGINAGDGCIIIATKEHLNKLEDRLKSYGVHVDSLISEKRYFPVVAEDFLKKFMVDNWPDEKLYLEAIEELMGQAGGNKRKIRAFSEIFSLLWNENNRLGTVRLEQFWATVCKKFDVGVFCAYPKNKLKDESHPALSDICHHHTIMISGEKKQMKQVYYTEITKASSSPIIQQTAYQSGGLSA
jgi:hypothetical protein